MPDQAQKLREIRNGAGAPAGAQTPRSHQRTIAITSGKGGVGKSSITINLAISLTRFGNRVLILDADFGLGNIDMLLGLRPEYTLQHVFSGRKTVPETLMTGPSGIRLLPSSIGGKKLEEVTLAMKRELLRQVRAMEETVDVILVDTGAGISDNIVDFLVLADEILLITTPEPTSIMDCYGVMKLLSQKRDRTLVRVLVNMAENLREARGAMNTLRTVSRQFFNVTLSDLGWIAYDRSVPRSVKQQQPFILLFPSSRASKTMNQVAARFANFEVEFITARGLGTALRRLVSFFAPDEK
ncbi:MAG: MinD/ParA family protein [bacterium]